jgi:chorismate mutase / prephenate dehydratase
MSEQGRHRGGDAHKPAGQDKVAFLGPAGTYSHAAALQLFPQGAAWVPVTEIEEVFSAVESGKADWGVVPVENSTEGSVLPTLDCFVQSSLQISAELLLRINHCLLVSTATKQQGIGKIVSHQQSLGQCRQWLKQHFPDTPLLTVSSNAEAALMASSSLGVAAVAGKTAAELYGLQVLHECIEDSHDNMTRFLRIGRLAAEHSSGKDKTSIIIQTQNEPGTLFRALEPFHRHGINLIKLESRPSRQAAWSYFFYVDLEGHVEDKSVHAALDELARLAIGVKMLGSYPAGGLK